MAEVKPKVERIGGNETEDLYRLRSVRFSDEPFRMFAHSKQHLDVRAKYVMAYIERWGLVAGMEDGEDSAGRQKLRLATPEELVTRSVAMVDSAWEQLSKRGWIYDAPELERFMPDPSKRDADNAE